MNCNLKKGDRIILFTDTRKDMEIVRGFFSAALNLELDVKILLSEPLPIRGDPPGHVISFLRSADLVVNLLTVEWLYQESHSQVLNAGARVLMCVESTETLLRLPPDETVVRRVEISQELLRNCREFRVKSEFGTDFVVRRGDRRVNARTGFPKKPGEFANFPNSIVNFAPLEDSATGSLVLGPGDCLIQHRRFITDPIRCRLKDGAITDIDGTGPDTLFFKASLSKFNDPSVYVVSHIGWGCEHRAEIDQMTYRPMELESYAGNVLLAFGSNDASSLGGKNKSPTHLDVCMLNADVWVDNEQFISKGRFVHPKLAQLSVKSGIDG